MPNEFALVTGASSGIGLSLAKELANRGYDLAICAESNRLRDAARLLEECGVQVFAVQEDLATREGVVERKQGTPFECNGRDSCLL